MKKPIFVILVLIITIVTLIAIRSAVSTRILTSGLELGQVRDETNHLKTENALLREKIYSLSSLAKISEDAHRAGFVESKSNFAVTAAQPIALKQ